jgi:spore coat-associated protein N
MILRTRSGATLAAVKGGSLASKLLLSAALLGSAAGIAGLGTFATFTSSTPAQAGVLGAGTVSVQVGATGTSANRLTVGATGVMPGDTIQRSVDLSSTGSTAAGLSAITLTTSASPSSLLDTDATNGLQVAIDSCSLPWVEAGAPAYTYTCAGTTQSVLASRPVIGTDLALSHLTSLTSGNTDHLRVTMTLPSTAGNSFQGISSGIGFVFTGTQRAGTSK